MYKPEKTILSKYEDWCKQFDIAPVEDAKETVYDYFERPDGPFKDNQRRREVIKNYLKVCKHFNTKPIPDVEQKSISYITDAQLRVVNNEILKKYKGYFKNISDLIARGYMIDCVISLYDQEIYELSDETLTAFMQCQQDKTKYKAVYEAAGGDPKIFPLYSFYREEDNESVLYDPLDEDEDEDDEWDEFPEDMI